MRSELSINPAFIEEHRKPAPPLNDQVKAIGETVDHTRRDVRMIRQQFDKHVEEYQHRIQLGVGIVVLLVLAAVGVSWYGHSIIQEYGAVLNQIPGIQSAASVMDARMSSVEGKAGEWGSLTDRMAKLETTVGSNLKTARTQAQSFANQMGQRIREELQQDLQLLQARLGNVESAQRQTQDQVVQLNTEIAGLHEQIAGMQKQNAQDVNELRQATEADVSRIDNRMATMDNQVTAHNDKIAALNSQVDRDRVNFEVSNDKTAEVAPGIYVTVKHIDVARQKVDGWMQLAEDGRIVRMSGLGAQEALTFVTRSDNRTHELVFTGIEQGRASGYLLLPK